MGWCQNRGHPKLGSATLIESGSPGDAEGRLWCQMGGFAQNCCSLKLGISFRFCNKYQPKRGIHHLGSTHVKGDIGSLMTCGKEKAGNEKLNYPRSGFLEVPNRCILTKSLLIPHFSSQHEFVSKGETQQLVLESIFRLKPASKGFNSNQADSKPSFPAQRKNHGSLLLSGQASRQTFLWDPQLPVRHRSFSRAEVSLGLLLGKRVDESSRPLIDNPLLLLRGVSFLVGKPCLILPSVFF